MRWRLFMTFDKPYSRGGRHDGRQPWTISGVLPTHLSVSSLSSNQLWFSIAGFALFYTVLLIIELYLMLKYIKLNPRSLHTGRYFFEQQPAAAH